jgi:hypothetical protein
MGPSKTLPVLSSSGTTSSAQTSRTSRGTSIPVGRITRMEPEEFNEHSGLQESELGSNLTRYLSRIGDRTILISGPPGLDHWRLTRPQRRSVAQKSLQKRGGDGRRTKSGLRLGEKRRETPGSESSTAP